MIRALSGLSVPGNDMQVAVAYQNDRLEFDIPEDRLVAQWQGPGDRSRGDALELVLDALEHPRDYPPLRQAVVPGDQVVIAFDPQIPDADAVLAAVYQVLREAEVAAGDVTVVVPPPAPPLRLPEGVALEVHDPEDRTRLAYLSTTTGGQRVYLNRRITDADFVLPVGLFGYDAVLGYRGPWSAMFPDLSDTETRRTFRSQASGERLPAAHTPPTLAASTEVSWLLGSQFHLGLLGAVGDLSEAIAGLESSVRTDGMRALDRLWSFDAGSRSELVVAGVGRPGRPTSIEELAEGLSTAARLVQRGGKIVLLSRAEGAFGPAIQRLLGIDDPRGGEKALRGHESDRDFPAAQQFARGLAWADVYLLSNLPSDEVEELSMIALDRPEEARRLVAGARSCTFVSQAERTRAVVEDADQRTDQ
ncbi:MAG: lactate racemase domain-containing protein [Isosphaeraceae bacterium]|nr:lactate racemase domain-containing protein [Isosphaeraceae bacterium]